MPTPTKAQIAIMPNLEEATYERPYPPRKPDAKSCGNCGLWIESNECVLHGDRAVFSWDNCSYHVSGTPAKRAVRLHVVPLDPKLSGLGYYPFGTSCSTCPSFRPDARGPGASCVRVRNGSKLARVEPMGCCALYSGR